MTKTRRLGAVAVAALALIVSAAVAVLAAPEDVPPPTRPPYLLRNGVPVLDSLPRRVPVVDANGGVATVPRACLFKDTAQASVDCAALPVAEEADIYRGE